MGETQPEPTPEPQPEPTPEVPEVPAEGEPVAPAPGEPTEPGPTEGEPPAAEPPAPSQEGEASELQGMSEADWEKRFKATDKAFDTYSRAIGRIWEEDATDLIPLTISPSAPPGFLHPQDAGHIPDEVKGPLLSFLGITQEVEYRLDPSKVACSLCGGLGKTATESQVPEYRVLICRVCKGTGLAPTIPEQANGPAPLVEVPALVGAESEPQPAKDADDWGHPRLLADGMPNPNYGKMPQYVDPQFP